MLNIPIFQNYFHKLIQLRLEDCGHNNFHYISFIADIAKIAWCKIHTSNIMYMPLRWL